MNTPNELEATRTANVTLDTENALLRQALRVIRKGLTDDQDGEFWTARHWLDRRGIFHGDLSGHRVLELVAKHALHGPASGAPVAVDERSTERATAESTGVYPTAIHYAHGPTLQESQRAVDAEDRYPQMRRAMSDVIAQRELLRAALVKIVGVDTRAELEQLEAVMRLMPAPAEDKAATIDAIHALLATEAA